MHAPRFRITIRRMTILVAAAGLLLGVGLGLWKRRARLERTAGEHLSEAQRAADIAWGFQRFGINPDGSVPPENATQARRSWEAHARHKALGEKYQRAARSPWLPVASNPPEAE